MKEDLKRLLEKYTIEELYIGLAEIQKLNINEDQYYQNTLFGEDEDCIIEIIEEERNGR